MKNKELIEERRERFIKRYKEAFGIELEVKPLTEEDGEDSEDKVVVVNYYGIKSPWM